MKFPVRVYFNSFGNVQPSHVIGQIRRLADEFGRVGIEAKRGQTNTQIVKQGYLRLVWPTRALAIRYQNAVAQLWGHLASSRRFKRP